MAWRIDRHVVRGEIDNRTRGRVTGLIWFAVWSSVVHGAIMAVQRETFQELGCFDDDFYVFNDDVAFGVTPMSPGIAWSEASSSERSNGIWSLIHGQGPPRLHVGAADRRPGRPPRLRRSRWWTAAWWPRAGGTWKYTALLRSAGPTETRPGPWIGRPRC